MRGKRKNDCLPAFVYFSGAQFPIKAMPADKNRRHSDFRIPNDFITDMNMMNCRN